MSIFVKICGLRDARCVAAAVAAGADAVGFVFAESPRRVSPDDAYAASRQIPDTVQRVAVMRHPSNAEWQAVLEVFAPDVLQTDADDFAKLEVPDNVIRWPVIREGDATMPATQSDVFVYEGRNSGAGETVDWSRAAAMADHGRMILAGGLAADNVAVAIQTARPWGVDVSSGVESGPGQKDIGLIHQFVSAARAAES
ncbi:MAG: phosphoribosylanthranilate isomerase [Gammaproteobacteria bacterium]|nr:phosphoribosylanthranilate isomerase [Gammaproteobacteria bacterium]MDH3432507.1 phosphoribosylanthranilate isomerase [Gammaproteobacteria bacterium]